MRKLWIVLMIGLFLVGCGAEETYETVADEIDVPAGAVPQQIYMELPEEAVLPAMESDSGTIYFCRDFEVSVQTVEAGDLRKTIQSVSGFEPEKLTVMQTRDSLADRYEFVWTSAAELGEQINRAAILDDGNYHYILTATADADLAKEYGEVWNGLFQSFSLY